MTIRQILPLAFLVLTACSSSKKEPEKEAKVPKTAPVSGTTRWDYDRIREARAAEGVQTPAALRADAEDPNCVLMSRNQMIRANASGCRPVDARSGQGADTYCCPK